MLARLLTGTLLVCLLLSGCGRSGLGREEEVSGKVTYNGKPLPGGWITFMSSKGYTFNGVIDPEGNYKVRVLVGEARIAVDNRKLENKQDKQLSPRELRRKMGMTPAPGTNVEEDKSSPAVPAQEITGTYVPIPKKYYAPDASGLTYTVTSGSQTHNIELSD